VILPFYPEVVVDTVLVGNILALIIKKDKAYLTIKFTFVRVITVNCYIKK
jgi:hypothetical protein